MSQTRGAEQGKEEGKVHPTKCTFVLPLGADALAACTDALSYLGGMSSKCRGVASNNWCYWLDS